MADFEVKSVFEKLSSINIWDRHPEYLKKLDGSIYDDSDPGVLYTFTEFITRHRGNGEANSFRFCVCDREELEYSCKTRDMMMNAVFKVQEETLMPLPFATYKMISWILRGGMCRYSDLRMFLPGTAEGEPIVYARADPHSIHTISHPSTRELGSGVILEWGEDRGLRIANDNLWSRFTSGAYPGNGVLEYSRAMLSDMVVYETDVRRRECLDACMNYISEELETCGNKYGLAHYNSIVKYLDTDAVVSKYSSKITAQCVGGVCVRCGKEVSRVDDGVLDSKERLHHSMCLYLYIKKTCVLCIHEDRIGPVTSRDEDQSCEDLRVLKHIDYMFENFTAANLSGRMEL